MMSTGNGNCAFAQRCVQECGHSSSWIAADHERHHENAQRGARIPNTINNPGGGGDNNNELPPQEGAGREAHSHAEAYDEIKRLLIFAGIFFLFLIALVLLKFQVSVDDVFRWSPVVWLIGVVCCALLMNLFLHFRRFLRQREAKRERERLHLLYALHLPGSFPCLAPPPQRHRQFCCRHRQMRQQLIAQREASPYAPNGLPAVAPPPLPRYEQIGQCPLVSPPAFVLVVDPDRLRNSNVAPPKYKVGGGDSGSSQCSLLSSSDEEGPAPPRYEESTNERPN